MYQEEPLDWQLVVKWRNGSFALELFPASGQLGENTTTRWYKAPRYENVVFEQKRNLVLHPYWLHQPSQTPKKLHIFWSTVILALKVHKIEIFFGFDFEICIISLIVM